MIISSLLPPLAIICSAFLTECHAWQTADDCSADNLNTVNEGMVDALNMAIYAKYRAAASEGTRYGTSLQNFLGAPNEDDATSLNLVQSQLIIPTLSTSSSCPLKSFGAVLSVHER